ncbi:DNA mismatch repair protein Msh2 isoform X1 [Neodiprion virginianus]|uniref:DNA mismatch repair protein Msh2 isoform X1 n=2 Tax=Neodiprion virginianus TaxID=2961670 RepID=UPI001EE746CE|nr:DNA mismatch repair protein Msh2 isoform X1 [Neodiprion virginianus]
MAVQPNQQFNMDNATQQSFIRFFKNLPEKPSSTIRFFNRTEYYTLHGSDALFAAKEIYKSTAGCKMLGAEPYKTEGLILSKSNFENFVRDLLLVKQYRVEVFVNQGSGKNQDWILEYKGSPGNLVQFEDILFSNNDVAVSTSVMAVKLGGEAKNRIVGVSCVDSVERLIAVCEFADDDLFSNLEALVISFGPKECLIIQGDGSQEFQTLKQLMERSNIMVTLRKKSDFSTDSIVQDMNTLLNFKKGQQRNAQTLVEMNLKVAMAGTSAIIKYLELTSDEGNFNQFKVKQLEQSRFVRLDAAAVRALSIEPRCDLPSGTSTGAPNSILNLLDRCRTPQGHRLISQWIRQPLRDIALIKERHDIVETLVKDNELRSSLMEDHLRRVPDLQQLAKKLAKKKVTLQDCCRIYFCVSHLPVLTEQLCNAKYGAAMKAMIVDPLRELISDMDKYQQMIEQTIDLEAAEKGDYMVKPEFNNDLQELKLKMNDLEEEIQGLINKVATDLSLEAGKVLKLESNQQFGYYFRITLKEEKSIRNKKGYTTIDSNKSGVRFTNQKLTSLNEDFISVRDQYLEEQKSVISEIINIAAGYTGPVHSIGSVTAQLDVLTAFALASANAPRAYVRPEMCSSDVGELNLIQARHPCLELQEGVDFIANDVSFKRDECTFHIITGPNMGGKSTYIRTTGVVALLAHIGCFVPCDSAKISILDCILARVGADDSQTKGLSTFMTEMIETAAILRTATSNSLVIIDELGRGTSTYEGCGIAWSIADHLATELKPYCLFATHFHEITRLAEDVPTVKNLQVTAVVGDNKLTLLYRVKPGVCDQSFGIHVAKMANFPDDVVEAAEKKLIELEDCQKITFEGSDDPAARRKIIKAGDELIANFAAKCKALDPSLTKPEIENKIQLYKEEILSHNNPYINALLSSP